MPAICLSMTPMRVPRHAPWICAALGWAAAHACADPTRAPKEMAERLEELPSRDIRGELGGPVVSVGTAHVAGYAQVCTVSGLS